MRIGANAAIAIGTVCLVAIMIAAIANQTFSWWVVPFVILFGTIFAGVLAVCWLMYREDKLRRSAMLEYPNEPWAWDAKWRGDVMKSRSTSELWGTLAFTTVLAMFAIIGIFSLIQGLGEGNLWVLLNLIPIVAAAYFGRSTFAAWTNLRLEKNVLLRNEGWPVWVGDRFSARMETKPDHPPEQIEAWLEHFKVVRREESDGVSFEKVVDRKLQGQVDDLGHGKFRVSADIPQDCPATSWTEDAQKRWWDLVISARISGAQVKLRYEIPVADAASEFIDQ